VPILYRLIIRTTLGRVQHRTGSPGKERRGQLDWGETRAPIRIPADPEPHDPLVRKDRPKEVEDEKEIGHRPGDEAVEFGRATARLGRRRWRERSQGRRWGSGLVHAPPTPTRLVSRDHHMDLRTTTVL
jgi:hypothetical protein